MLLPLASPGTKKNNHPSGIVLAGDVGATKTSLGLFKYKNKTVTILREAKFISHEFKNFIQLLEEFQKELPLPDSVCFGVAGPVLNDHAKLSNIGWDIDSRELSDQFGIKNVHLINDLEATAYGLEMLDVKDSVTIHPGSEKTTGNAAIIAPGTGLGEAGLYWDGDAYHPFATEGGHCDFAPRTEFDFELYTFLQKKFGHVSWERVVCGPGILNIYHFLRDLKNRNEPGWLKEKIKKTDAAAIISQHVNQSDICNETMQLFIRYLAYEAANLALKFKATGGLFIGGGIAPQIVSLFKDYKFLSSFFQSGRLNYLLEKAPVKIILNTKTALLGAAWYGAGFISAKQKRQYRNDHSSSPERLTDFK